MKLNKSSLTVVARKAVLAASKFIASRLATTEAEQTAEVWIADADDQEQIGDPVAGIVQRRGLSGTVDSDTAALIEVAIGIVAYLIKNVSAAFDARKTAKQQTRLGGGIVNHSTGEPA